MSSVEPQRLTDCLWLAAHDSLDGKPRIGEWSLGVGLATGMLGELIHNNCLEVREGEIFRADGSSCDDPALRPLLDKMAAEEASWPPTTASATPRPRAPVDPHAGWEPPYPPHHGADWPTQAFDTRAWPTQPAATSPWPPAPGSRYQNAAPPEHTRHRKRGHDLRKWMSYLAYDRRAETLVVDRLTRTGLAQRQERRRWVGGSTVRYVPRDSVVAGTPASRVRIAVQSGRGLSRMQLLLAGLFLATGLHHHALETLSPLERSQLADELKTGLDDMSRELLRTADAAIGEAAMR
jgi:hypothetical protein